MYRVQCINLTQQLLIKRENVNLNESDGVLAYTATTFLVAQAESIKLIESESSFIPFDRKDEREEFLFVPEAQGHGTGIRSLIHAPVSPTAYGQRAYILLPGRPTEKHPLLKITCPIAHKLGYSVLTAFLSVWNSDLCKCNCDH